MAAADQHQIDAVWFQPNDPVATAHIHLAWTRLVRGDLTGAEAELAQAARRAEQLGFPQGPYSLAYTRFAEIWLRIEAGQLDRAAVLAADLTRAGRAARLRPMAAGRGHRSRPPSRPWPHSAPTTLDPATLRPTSRP